MKILVTGATGFIGKNLCSKLETLESINEIYKTDSKTSEEEIRKYTQECDFVFNLAAVHRPKDNAEFKNINTDKFNLVLSSLQENKNCCPVLYTSSIQAQDESPYGNSKRLAENLLKQYTEMHSTRGIVYRLTNTFGKWARPNGHSVIATFCYNINHNLPIVINDPSHIMHLYYIDDVVESFITRLGEKQNGFSYYSLPNELMYNVTLQDIADKLYEYKKYKDAGDLPQVSTEFEKKLWITFSSY